MELLRQITFLYEFKIKSIKRSLVHLCKNNESIIKKLKNIISRQNKHIP
jgi:hypothetical protein